MTKYREILRLSALGLTLREIAASLQVSQHTIIDIVCCQSDVGGLFRAVGTRHGDFNDGSLIDQRNNGRPEILQLWMILLEDLPTVFKLH